MEFYGNFSTNFDIFCNNLLLAILLKLISFFKENNIEIALLTARGGGCPEIIDLTKEYLEKHKLYFDKYIF